ncbi:MAG TPA: biopolymer transporter ExbD [Terriglobia bacterium]|jgi:biopolymer transport protein ExbD|nr:biopolymer transporter ExbD [Terriglobia bacterium]
MPGHAKAPPTVSDINVTPLVDVMLVLLIIFMVITPLLQKNVSVDLARTANPRAMPDDDREDSIEVAITRDGKVFLKKNPISVDDITPKVRDMISGRLDKTVYIRSDARAKYGDVTKAVDAVRAAGVEQLGLLTAQLERPGAPATPAPAP